MSDSDRDEFIVAQLTSRQDPLYAYILSMVPDVEAARDACQETCMVLSYQHLIQLHVLLEGKHRRPCNHPQISQPSSRAFWRRIYVGASAAGILLFLLMGLWWRATRTPETPATLIRKAWIQVGVVS